jgi:hypothetical protein
MSPSRTNTPVSSHPPEQSHIVIVEAYAGRVEFYSDEPEEQQSARGLGLPVAEIVAQLGGRLTILDWQDWWTYESQYLQFSTPPTQPTVPPTVLPPVNFSSDRITRSSIPAIDPDYELPFQVKGLSPRSYGLINDSGFIYFAAYCLHHTLQNLYQQDPFQAVLLPLWGGLGYVAQMAKATHAPNQINVPFGLVVTDHSLSRQQANQEGKWTRHAVIRRQMEDVSLALADRVFVFGTRGKELAIAGRLPDAAPPIFTPRRVEATVLDDIAKAATRSTSLPQSAQFFLYEPQQAASGILTALDAVQLLNQRGIFLNHPIISAGSAMVFAPMKPRNFSEYWSTRGFVQELMHDRQWQWQEHYPNLEDRFAVRLYPSHFEYLPNIWAELAKGSLVLLSPATAEGLAPGAVLPPEVVLNGEPTPELLADALERLATLDVPSLDNLRQELCKQVVQAHRGTLRQQWLTETITALRQMLLTPPPPQDLSRVALLFSDRLTPLQVLDQQYQDQQDQAPAPLSPHPHTKTGTLSVVITCYKMGTMLKEAIASVWASAHRPDEVLVVDDGSPDEPTLAVLQELEQDAAAHNLPFKVIRQRNAGLAAARNTGLKAATGELISFLDGDDLIESPFYDIAIQLLKQYPRLGGVAAWASIFGEDVSDGFWNAPQAELPFLLIENSVIVPCVTRTALLRDLGGYDVRQRYNYEDWELSIRMLASGWPIVTIPMHLMKYRIRGDSLFRSMTDVQNQVMREQLLTTHRELVAKFAVEIAMQIEHQWKQLADADRPIHSLSFLDWLSGSNHQRAARLVQRVLTIIQPLLHRLNLPVP